MAPKLCTDPTHNSTPTNDALRMEVLIKVCRICQGERLEFQPTADSEEIVYRAHCATCDDQYRGDCNGRWNWTHVDHAHHAVVWGVDVDGAYHPQEGPFADSAAPWPITAVFDETHVHTDAQLRTAIQTRPDPYGAPGWGMTTAIDALADQPGPLTPEEINRLQPFRRGAPKTPEAAIAAFDAITEGARRRRDAELAAEEAVAKEYLTRRVERAVEGIDLTRREPTARLLAEAAVEVFVDYLRNPPTRG